MLKIVYHTQKWVAITLVTLALRVESFSFQSFHLNHLVWFKPRFPLFIIIILIHWNTLNACNYFPLLPFQFNIHLGLKQINENETIVSNQWTPSLSMTHYRGYGSFVESDPRCRGLMSGTSDGLMTVVDCDTPIGPPPFNGLCQHTPCISVTGVPCVFPFR